MKNFILIAMMSVVGLSYGQSTISLYTYESLNGISQKEADIDEGYYSAELNEVKTPASDSENQRDYNSQIGTYSYESLAGLNAEFIKAKAKSKEQIYAEASAADRSKSRKNIVIRKAKTEVLVRYNGDYSSLKLIDAKGKEVDANFSEKYRGLIVPRSKKAKKYFLEVEKEDKSKVFYHQIVL
ncbi:hypothetical protein ACXGQW_05025 [Wenyingzhuangia sp. IMCC45533]